MIARILLALIISACAALAEPTDSVDVSALFAQANDAYITGDYRSAIDTYSAIEATGRVSPALMENLAAAYRAAGDEGSATWAEKSAFSLAGERWVIVEVIGILTLAGIVLWCVLAKKEIPRLPLRAMVVAVLVAVVGGVAGTLINAKRFDGAIVVTPSPLLVSPFDGAEPTANLAAGDAVRIERHHAGFALVNLLDGTHGWLPDQSVRAILPHS